jgi:Flp pilus assembly pilin Flp
VKPQRQDNRFQGDADLTGEEGQTLVEYALILMFVSIVALGLTPLGTWLAARFSDLSAAL